MKIEIKGSCLSGADSRLEIATCERFRLYMHEKSRKPTSIPLSVKNIIVKNHLHPHILPSYRWGIATECRGFSQSRRLRRGCFVSIGHKHRVNVVEHFFSALYGLYLFNVRVDVFGNEIPFFDGSSQEFVASLKKMQKHTISDVLRVDKKLSIENGKSFITYEPLEEDKLIIEMKLCHPYIKRQKITLEINEENYMKEIAPARTFVFTDTNDPRLKNLPPYGFGITKNRIYSVVPLRFPDEAVRHKVLDLMGDLFVLKKRLMGKIICRNTSHYLNLQFVKKLLIDCLV